ncbi:MAG: glycine oxidase ThiO [Acidobacteriota bacterium]
MKADIIIIGGGLIGCAVAAELATHKLHVRLFERGQLGREASWAAAGMLAPQTEAENAGHFFELCSRSRDSYSSYVAGLRELTGLDPCYRTEGALQLALNESSAQVMEHNYNWQFSAGLPIERLKGEDVRKLAPAVSSSVTTALFFPREHQIDNRKLTECVISAGERRGVEFRAGALVTNIIIESGVVRGVIANGERHEAAKVINAAGSWASLFAAGPLRLPMLTPVRGQMLALKLPAGRLNHVLHYEDVYLVPRWDGTILVGSTTEQVGYDQRVTAAALQRLLKQAQIALPELADATFINAWAGLRPATYDGLPLLGEHKELPGLLFATGHYRNGILLAPITATLIAESVLCGHDVATLAPFTPSRFALAG